MDYDICTPQEKNIGVKVAVRICKGTVFNFDEANKLRLQIKDASKDELITHCIALLSIMSDS